MPAPKGNQNAARGRKWRAAIDRALDKRSRLSQKEALDELAEVLLAAAEAGEGWALKELGDRLEGKPAQAIVGDSDADPINVIGRIERVIRSDTRD